VEAVLQDIEGGALRFVRLEKDAIFDRLIKDSLAKNARQRETADGHSTSEDQVTVDPESVSLAAVIEALPHMNHRVRKVLALSNFFRLPTPSIAQVLEVPPEASFQMAGRINLRLISMDKMLEPVKD
jgi:hypothetical protein